MPGVAQAVAGLREKEVLREMVEAGAMARVGRAVAVVVPQVEESKAEEVTVVVSRGL